MIETEAAMATTVMAEAETDMNETDKTKIETDQNQPWRTSAVQVWRTAACAGRWRENQPWGAARHRRAGAGRAARRETSHGTDRGRRDHASGSESEMQLRLFDALPVRGKWLSGVTSALTVAWGGVVHRDIFPS